MKTWFVVPEEKSNHSVYRRRVSRGVTWSEGPTYFGGVHNFHSRYFLGLCKKPVFFGSPKNLLSYLPGYVLLQSLKSWHSLTNRLGDSKSFFQTVDIIMRLWFVFLQGQTPSNPTTTVFVGNITDRASDAMIRQILMVFYNTYSLYCVIEIKILFEILLLGFICLSFTWI